jgi:hypothetical protein
MQKFDMGAAWSDARLLLSSYGGLVWAVAGVFLLLPQFVMGLSAPPPPTLPNGATFEQMMTAWQPWFQQVFPYQLIGGLLTLIGTLSIMRLWLTRTSISVGEAIKGSFLILIPVFVAQLLTSVAMFFGFMALIIPGLFLAARFSLVAAVAADQRARGPIGLISASWNLTRGNALSLIFYYFLIFVAVAVVYLVAIMILGGLVSWIPSIGPVLGVLVESVLTMAVTVVILAVTTAVYRQLVGIADQQRY